MFIKTAFFSSNIVIKFAQDFCFERGSEASHESSSFQGLFLAHPPEIKAVKLYSKRHRISADLRSSFRKGYVNLCKLLNIYFFFSPRLCAYNLSQAAIKLLVMSFLYFSLSLHTIFAHIFLDPNILMPSHTHNIFERKNTNQPIQSQCPARRECH